MGQTLPMMCKNNIIHLEEEIKIFLLRDVGEKNKSQVMQGWFGCENYSNQKIGLNKMLEYS